MAFISLTVINILGLCLLVPLPSMLWVCCCSLLFLLVHPYDVSCLYLVFLYCFLEIIFENLCVEITISRMILPLIQCRFSFFSLLIGFIPFSSQNKVKDILLRSSSVVCAELWLFPSSSVKWPKAGAYGILPVSHWALLLRISLTSSCQCLHLFAWGLSLVAIHRSAVSDDK